ncbi:TNFAIP3-interacting protein 1-like [Erpetoichthys calabaricus]|uniref:TNFAIP3-interacting protein 1-like n=1 Tax=Erpetoichthys calabaricus TaxID=27687 RepID=UPI002234DB69|nr:TNFAIP3-interacting protein 1-like [Erpetoichthys calabaricus]
MTEHQPVGLLSEAREGLKSDITVSSLEALKQQIKTLETQREEVLRVNKQWDKHVKMMKQSFEQKVMEMQKSLTALQKDNSLLKEGMEQKQREFDKKLILAKQRIEKQMEENENMCAALKEVTRQNQCLHEQNAHITRKKEQQECEIRRLNNVLEGAMQTSDKEEMRTQIEVLRHQVQIYEEDFKKERNDREILNDKKEQLESEIHMLKSQRITSIPSPIFAHLIISKIMGIQWLPCEEAVLNEMQVHLRINTGMRIQVLLLVPTENKLFLRAIVIQTLQVLSWPPAVNTMQNVHPWIDRDAIP